MKSYYPKNHLLEAANRGEGIKNVSESPADVDGNTWKKFPDEKPELGQICIVVAGAAKHSQYVALQWCGKLGFCWAVNLELDAFPTTEVSYWMPWPDDPTD